MSSAAASTTNVFACLVHERQESVVDLVRNLTYLDPDSRILLYDGGRDPALLRRRFSVDGREPLVHPTPRPLSWGVLHQFAIDSMRFALEELSFDTFTVVDSDQLLARPGYSATLARFLDGTARVGMLGNAPFPQPPSTRVAPVVTAWRERELWLPYLRRFAGGEAKFPHWTFWPSTVFTVAACRDLVRLFDEDEELARVLAASRLWATEEVVLPTLVAALGHDVVQSPFSYDLVRYNVTPTLHQLREGMERPDVYWVHPVPRALDHPLRRAIRDHHAHYAPPTAPAEAQTAHPLVLRVPILERMQAISGWLDDWEADLLIAAAARALTELPSPHAVVEVGSFCGRGTVVLGSVARAIGNGVQVHAVDPHDGVVGALDQGTYCYGPTRARFDQAIADAALSEVVVPVTQRSWETAWDRPISFLLVDWLHDYHSVSRDFRHFEPWLVNGAHVAFHDYADYYPGVMRFVDELLTDGGYARVAQAGSLIVLYKAGTSARPRKRHSRKPRVAPRQRAPLVSCVMATYDRPHLVPTAVASFLRQDYPSTELLVVDDGPESLAGLLPDDTRVRHIRLDRRHTIGAKRNLGCEAARGEVLANWDDDDWYAPWRLRYQVERLAADGAEVCGLNRLIYLQPERRLAWRYQWPESARPWVHDAVLLFTREFWRRNPFPDTSMGIDCRLLWTRTQKRILALPDERFYVGMIHGGNTSPKNTSHGVWQPYPVEDVERLLGADVEAYRWVFDGVSEPLRGARRPPRARPRVSTAAG
jgi:hypothetical protein